MSNKRIWVNGKPTKIEIRDELPHTSNVSFDFGLIVYLLLIGGYIWFDCTHDWVIANIAWIICKVIWIVIKTMIHLATFGYLM